LAAKEYVGDEPFIVQLADNIIFHDYRQFIKNFDKCKVLLANVDDISRYGIAEFNDGRISNLVEKPTYSKSNLALVGLYIFTREIFDFIDNLIPSIRGEYEITHAINNLLKKYKYLNYDICSRWWKDTGTPNDMLEANKFVLQNILKCDSLVNSSSKLINTSINEFVSIGKQCNISNCTMKNSIVFNNVKIENTQKYLSFLVVTF
jgi:glucose-1-phosphate thymidylyltransferase